MNYDDGLEGLSMEACMIESPMLDESDYLIGQKYNPFTDKGITWFDGNFAGGELTRTLYMPYSEKLETSSSNKGLQEILGFISSKPESMRVTIDEGILPDEFKMKVTYNQLELEDMGVTEDTLRADAEAIEQTLEHYGPSITGRIMGTVEKDTKTVMSFYLDENREVSVSSVLYPYTDKWFGVESLDLKDEVRRLQTEMPEETEGSVISTGGMAYEINRSYYVKDDLIHDIAFTYYDEEADHAVPTTYFVYRINQTSVERKLIMDHNSYMCYDGDLEAIKEAYNEAVTNGSDLPANILDNPYLIPVELEDNGVRCYVLAEDSGTEFYGVHPVVIDFVYDGKVWLVDKVVDSEVEKNESASSAQDGLLSNGMPFEPIYNYTGDSFSELFALNILDQHDYYTGRIDDLEYMDRWQWFFPVGGNLQGEPLYSYGVNDGYDRTIKVSQALYHDDDDFAIALTLERLNLEDKVIYRINKYTVDLSGDRHKVTAIERDSSVVEGHTETELVEVEKQLVEAYYDGPVEWYTTVRWVPNGKGDGIIDNLQYRPANTYSLDKGENSLYSSDEDDEFSLFYDGGEIPLRTYDHETDMETLLGESLSDTVIRADTDTVYVGTHFKTTTYEGLEIGTYGTQFRRGPYLILKMTATGERFNTARGVGIGDSVEALLDAYPDCKVWEKEYVHPDEMMQTIRFLTDGEKVIEIKIEFLLN